MRPPSRFVVRALLIVVVGLVTTMVLVRHPAAPFLGTVSVGGQPDALALDAATGHLFVATRRPASVLMLSTATGHVLHRSAVAGTPVTVAVVSSVQRAVVLLDPPEGGMTATVGLLDTRTGALLRTITLGQGALDTPAPATGPSGGHVFLTAVAVDEHTAHVFVLAGGRRGHTVFMLAARSGRVLQVTRVGANPSSVALDPRTHHAFVVNTDEDTVSVLDTRNGRLLGTRRVGQGPLTVAVDSLSSRAFVSNSVDATVSVLETRTGRVLRTVAVAPDPQALVVVPEANRVVVRSADSGRVSLLDAQRGVVLHTVKTSAQPPVADTYTPPVAAVAVGQRVFLLGSGGPPLGYQVGPLVTREAHPGAVRVLDARDGGVLQLWPVGLSPLTLAVDAPHHQLIVLNADGGTPPRPVTVGERIRAWLPPVLRPLLLRPPPPVGPANTGSVTILGT